MLLRSSVVVVHTALVHCVQSLIEDPLSKEIDTDRLLRARQTSEEVISAQLSRRGHKTKYQAALESFFFPLSFFLTFVENSQAGTEAVTYPIACQPRAGFDAFHGTDSSGSRWAGG